MLDRRAFLKSGAVALFGLGAGPSFLHRAALAAAGGPAPGRRPVLVAVFLRGGLDGLAAVPLLDDPHLAAARPELALPATGGGTKLLDLDGRFGLHPAFEPLLPLWRDGRLAVVHGAGSPDPTRSHFDAQDYMETGTPGRKGTASGWLNRAVGLTGHDAAAALRAVGLTPALPRSLTGPEPAIAVADLESFGLGASPRSRAWAERLEALYAASPREVLRETGAEAFEAARLLSGVVDGSGAPEGGARYPRSPLGESLRQIALLIKAGVGLEVAFAEASGWDTHVRQGAGDGSFGARASDLAAGLAAFWADLGAERDRVVVLTMTEFGRTVAQNGSGGTDHGHGSCLFVLGDRVAGGRVWGEVPELEPDALHDGRDLPVTTDFRSVFSELATTHLGARDDGSLFPGWRGSSLGLLTR